MSRSRSKTPQPASDQPRIFVDVRLSDGMDGGLMVREILEKLGARVLRSWAGTRARATHLVWKDGDARTQVVALRPEPGHGRNRGGPHRRSVEDEAVDDVADVPRRLG